MVWLTLKEFTLFTAFINDTFVNSPTRWTSHTAVRRCKTSASNRPASSCPHVTPRWLTRRTGIKVASIPAHNLGSKGLQIFICTHRPTRLQNTHLCSNSQFIGIRTQTYHLWWTSQWCLYSTTRTSSALPETSSCITHRKLSQVSSILNVVIGHAKQDAMKRRTEKSQIELPTLAELSNTTRTNLKSKPTQEAQAAIANASEAHSR